MRTLFFCLLSLMLNAQVSLVKGPYLQIGTPTSMIIRWETNVPTDSKVEYDTVSTGMNYYAGNLSLDTIHEVQITGLLPYTKYYYTIGTKTMMLQGDTNNYFVTSPLPGQEGKYRFWGTGDCGNMSTNQTNCKNQYNIYNKNGITNVWFSMGDHAYYNGTNYQFNTEFFGVYGPDIMKHAVFWPSPGNHDYDNGASTATTVPYYTVFSMPTMGEAGGVASGTEAYYSYDYGNVHFISMDSYGTNGNKRMYDTTSPQTVWLKQDLAANNSCWTVVYFHHPPYTMGSHNSDTEVALDSIRTYFIRIMERYGVDLVVCGHSHDYERSKLMRGHYGYEASFVSSIHNVDSSTALYDGSANSCPYTKDSINKPFGTVYVVSGSAGQLGGTQTSFPHDAMYYSNAADGGSFIIDVDGSRMDAKWLCADGVIRDHFTLFKNVNKVITYYMDTTQTLNLNASWPGNYLWSTSDTTRSINVAPDADTTFWVTDKFHCVADTFKMVIVPVGIKEVSRFKDQLLLLYPNPTKENIILKLNLEKHSGVGLKLYSSEGKLLKEYSTTDHEAGENNISVLITDLKLQNGIYFLEVSINGVRMACKFILDK